LEALDEYFEDREKLKQLCGYPWIINQLQPKENGTLII